MTQIFNLEQIKEALKSLDVVKAMEEGFVAYSEGRVVAPPVGELLFRDPPGEAHIKYGYIQNQEYYVIKIASGFYENQKLGISPSNGLMLLFKQRTGEVAGILLDEGHLTNVRTAAAGAVVAKYMAPKKVDCIGVLGAGIQARMQLQYIKPYVKCNKVMVWGVNDEECQRYKDDMEKEGYDVQICLDPGEIAQSCQFMITSTPAKTPLLKNEHIKKGVHITAMGSDTSEKNELDPLILCHADLVVSDSLEQSKTRGEIFKTISAGMSEKINPVELGNVVSGQEKGRTSDDQVTIADLTGVAIQDIQISVAIYKSLAGQ